MMSKEKTIKWLIGWFTIFLLTLLVYYGTTQYSIFGANATIGETSIGVSIESEKTIEILGVAYAFFISIILIALIWAGVKVYEIKSKKKRKKK